MAKKKQSAEAIPQGPDVASTIYVLGLDGDQVIFTDFNDVPDDYDGDVQVYSLVKVGRVKITRSLE
jgi:hypothetical protein